MFQGRFAIRITEEYNLLPASSTGMVIAITTLFSSLTQLQQFNILLENS